jgi:hypothetical protein
MWSPIRNDFSRVSAPIEIHSAAKQVICDVIAPRNRPEHFSYLRSLRSHFRISQRPASNLRQSNQLVIAYNYQLGLDKL